MNNDNHDVYDNISIDSFDDNNNVYILMRVCFLLRMYIPTIEYIPITWAPTIDIYPPMKLTFPLKMDGWNTSLSYWVSAYFQGANLLLVSGRVLPLPNLDMTSTQRRPAGGHSAFPSEPRSVVRSGKAIGLPSNPKGEPGWVSVEVLLFWDLRRFGNFTVK